MHSRNGFSLAFVAALATTLLATSDHRAMSAAPDELDKLLDQEGKAGSLGNWADPRAELKPSFPYFEHHGYFRFRADFFHNGHLSTVIPGDAKSGTSGIAAPLTENAINNSDQETSSQVGTDDAKVIASANIRLRYSPTLHVSESLRVHATFDILDNLVLGSTPDFDGNLSRPDAPLVAFSSSQAPPSDGRNGFRDSIRVKEAYGEFQPAFLLRVGRMASNWGLGILANAGDDVDDDFGDYTDRALILLKVFDIYVAAAWDYVYSGAISDDPAQAFGQAKDLGNADDVNQWVFSLFQRPLSEKEKEKRKVDVYERFKPSFDWGVYGVIRNQDFDLDQASYAEWRKNGGTKSYDELGLVKRNAFAAIPDLWLRYEQRFDYLTGLRVELEAAGVFGHIDNIGNEIGGADSPRDISQIGAALEVQYDNDKLSAGLDAGFATGDSAEGFGVLDRNTLAEQDGSPNKKVTAFKFDRDYHPDLLLFREVMGTVTNAVYLKPWIAYDLFDAPEDTLGLRLDLEYAQALVPEATPGNSSFLGFEADLRIFFHNAAGFQGDLEMGLLVPGGAFDYRPVDNTNNRDAGLAFTLQGRLTMKY
ncbi:MAG: TIGR04551 family protein [Myxococcota bacterium]